MKILKFVIVCLFVFQTAGIHAQLKPNPTDLIPPDALNQIIESLMLDGNISGLSAIIMKDGQDIWKGNFGISNRASNNTVNDSTTWLLYSITKTFTGIGLMQLHEKDSFDLDDPVNDYLPFQIHHPDYPGTDITFRMLMCHVSGIQDDWIELGPLLVYDEDSPLAIGDFLEDYLVLGGSYYNPNKCFTNQEPGTYSKYSNVGATLAGYLIEVVSGMPYSEYIESNILLPLQMERSKYYLAQMDTSNLAVQYAYNGGQYNRIGFMSSPMIPAGFLHSTRDEMAAYLKMIINRGSYNGVTILDSALFESMIIAHYPGVAPVAGLFFGYDDINHLWGHSGGSSGVKTTMFFEKEDDWGVIVLSNGGGHPWDVAYALYQYVRDHVSLSLTHAEIIDQNINLILESNETVDFHLYFRNNTLEDISDLNVTITSDCELISILDSVDYLDFLACGEEIVDPLDFSLELGNINEPIETHLEIYFSQNDEIVDSTTLEIFLGEAEILIVSDENHLYKNLANASSYYKNALTSNSKTYRLYDINLLNFPDYTFLHEFESVMWFTGLDNEEFNTIINVEKQALISSYLDNGGKLFLSSQNVSDAISGTAFFEEYLHAQQVNPDWDGILRIEGVSGNQIGNDLSMNIVGGDGSNTANSPSVIEAIGGAEKVFNYYMTEEGAGLMYSGDYKVVYLPYCFSSISSEIDRNELMYRILKFFDILAGIEHFTDSDLSFNIYPNPSTGKSIYIDCELQERYSVEIYDLSGALVYEDVLYKENGRLDLGKLSPGTYIVKVYSENASQSQKLIIN